MARDEMRRSAFEDKYPPPEGIEWVEELGYYSTKAVELLPQMDTYNEWFDVWVSALHSVEAEKEKIREPVSCEDRLPEPADADMYGDLLWLRSGIWVLGKQRNGVPVDATHWMHTP